MIFYRENIIKDAALLKIKKFFLIFLTLLSIIQLYISNFNETDLLIVLMILFSTFFMMIKIFNSKYIIEHFIPFLIVFFLNISYLSGPLIFKTILFQGVSSNLFLPIKTFAIASVYQIVVVLTLVFYVSSIQLKKISSFIANRIVFNLKGYVVPSLNFLYFIFIFFIINKIYLDIFDQGVNAFTEYGNIKMKILYGLDLFCYLPLFCSFHLFQLKKINKKHLYFILLLYCVSGAFFGLASNSRTTLFIFFFYLLFLVSFYKIFFFKKYSKFGNIITIIFVSIVLLSANFINETMLDLRKYRLELSAMELYKLSIGNKLTPENIGKQLSEESYTDNLILDRIITVKFLDMTLYYSQDFNKSMRSEFSNFVQKRLLIILPQNLINIFNKKYRKIDYHIANGSLTKRIYYGYDKGGLKGAGSYLSELLIIFDSYMLLYLIIFVLFLFIFTIFDSLQKKNELSFVFSPLLAVLIFRFIGLASAGGVGGIISLCTRGFIETVILNFLIISIYLKFFKNNENISNR